MFEKILVCLDGSKLAEQILPYAYNHYATIEVTLRHGEWLPKFTVERQGKSLLFSPSSIWSEMGKKIIPEEILQLLMQKDGEMFQTDIQDYFKKERKISETTTWREIQNLKRNKKIETFEVKIGKIYKVKVRLK